MSTIYPPMEQFNNGQGASPWFTVANQFLPRNLHDVIRWARYITIQSPTVTEVIRKYSTYPVTKLVIDTKSDKLDENYNSIFKSLKMVQALQDIGFEYYTNGNAFISIYFPIIRTLVCPSCKTGYNAKKVKTISYKNWKFHGVCEHCGIKTDFRVVDTKSKNIADMNIIRWNPLNISVSHNPITGEYEYYYKIPNDIKRRVMMGDTLFVNSLPIEFLDAIRHNQDFKFDNDNIFHLKNISTGAMVEGIAVPPLISLFSLVFYQATLRKANEAVATEHLNPLRVVFPQAQTGNSDPVVAMSLRNFAGNMEDAIRKHKKDKGYFLIAPGPIGYQAVGGEGRSLLVNAEIQQAEEAILLSLGVSRELLSGITNWTSSAIGLRMMENTMRGYVTQLEEVINWIMIKITTYLNLELAKVSLEPFKLTDDENVKNLILQLAQAGKVSNTTMYNSIGVDYNEEMNRIKEEKVSETRNQIEIEFEMEQARILAGKDIGEKISDSGGDYKKILDEAHQIAEQLYNADNSAKREVLHSLKMESYPLYLMVSKLLEEESEKSAQQELLNAQAEGLANGQPAEEGTGAEPGKEGEGDPAANKKSNKQQPEEQPEEQGQFIQ